MEISIKYETLEKLPICRPVDRLSYIADRCAGKSVLDVGCFDETALQKRDTEHWLHGRIASVARRVVGVDSSSAIPAEGLVTGENSVIYKENGMDINNRILSMEAFQVVVAGEFIEHIESPLHFFMNIRKAFPGRELIISTPNGGCFANTVLGLVGREVQHHDHLHNFSYKILNTLCVRAGFLDWEIIPYRFYATEMILSSRGAKRLLAQVVEKGIRAVEWIFPLLSFGYIVKVKL